MIITYLFGQLKKSIRGMVFSRINKNNDKEEYESHGLFRPDGGWRRNQERRYFKGHDI